MADTNQPSPSPKGQQYNLKWTNYTNNILQVFSDHLVQESLVDVTLVCEGHLVKAHKIILSACSFYFREIFEVYTDINPLIILNGVRFCDLKQIIEFMYRGEVKVQDADVEHLLQLAETLQVKGLCSVREKSAGLLPKGGDKENSDKEAAGTETKSKQQCSDVNAPSSRRSSKDSISLNLQTAIKREPGLAEGYNSGDESPLIIDESVGTSQNHALSDSGGTESRPKKRRTSKESEANTTTTTKKIGGPPNAFMIFTNEWREKLKKQYPNESNKEISVRLGNVWKNLSQSAKDHYYEAASKASLEDKKTKQLTTYSKKQKTENAKGMKYYEAIQLVKLVMPDDNESTSSSSNTVEVTHASKTQSISNGNDTSALSE